MSSIQWESDGGDRRLPVPIHTPKHFSVCVILGPLEACSVHWIPGQVAGEKGKSAPCTGENCFRCDRLFDKKRNCYASSLLWSDEQKQWTSIILSLNPSFENGIKLIESYRDFILGFKIKNDARKPKEYLVKAIEPRNNGIPDIEPIDVRYHLERFWGLRRSTPAKVNDSSFANHEPLPATIPFQTKSA